MPDASYRLATYGTLAPGAPNHHQLAGLAGRWTTGTVNGRLVASGWGAAQGYPALSLDPRAPAVAVHIFESPDLPAHWPRLDAFEGEGYRRVETAAATSCGPLAISIYVAVDRGAGPCA